MPRSRHSKRIDKSAQIRRQAILQRSRQSLLLQQAREFSSIDNTAEAISGLRILQELTKSLHGDTAPLLQLSLFRCFHCDTQIGHEELVFALARFLVRLT